MVALAAVTACTLIGCTRKKEASVANTKAEKAIALQSAEFVNKIEKEDYKNLLSYIYLPEDHFVTNDDIIWFLPRTSFSDLIGMRTDLALVSFEETSTPSGVEENGTVAKNVLYQSVEDSDVNYQLLYVLNKNNEWKLYLPDFLISEWSFVCSKDCDIQVNGKPVDQSYIEETYSGNEIKNGVKYKIPNVPKKKISVIITNKNRQKELEITPSSNTEIIK